MSVGSQISPYLSSCESHDSQILAGGTEAALNQSSGWRFALAASLIALTAILLQARSRTETIPPRQPLSSFPAQLGNWSGKDIPLDKETLDVLGAGEFLVRGYRDPGSDLPYVDLFLAYFPSQRTGDTIHSPKRCLPGAGWTPERNDQVTISLPGHSPFPANRYVIARAEGSVGSEDLSDVDALCFEEAFLLGYRARQVEGLDAGKSYGDIAEVVQVLAERRGRAEQA